MTSGTYGDEWFGPAYHEYWEPYLARAGSQLLDRVETTWGPPRPGARVLDVGAGTGLLTIEAVRRWQECHVIAADPGDAMLAVIRRRLDVGILVRRLTLVAAGAEVLPLPNASVDLAVSSFVLQLVSDRPATLREVRRVLMPGGGLGYVTWLKREGVFPPGEAVDAALGAPSDTDWSGGAPQAGDVPSAQAARDELVEAGFTDVHVATAELQYDWSADLYLRYVEGCRNATGFAILDDRARTELRARVRQALEDLPEEAFRSRSPVVFALARRPG